MRHIKHWMHNLHNKTSVRVASTFVLLVVELLYASNVSGAPLSKESEARLVYAHMREHDFVSLAVAAAHNRISDAASATEKLGGRVRYRHDPIDYLAVVLPLESVQQLLAESSIVAATVDHPDDDYIRFRSGFGVTGNSQSNRESPSTVPEVGQRASAPWPPTPSERPLEQPYSILKDLDAYTFRANHPTFDGRGVVIAHVESGAPDFLSPELQIAYDLEGHEIPKFTDVVSIPDYVPTLNDDPQVNGVCCWIKLSEHSTEKPRASFLGEQYRLPDGGTYRFGELVMPSEGYFTYLLSFIARTYTASSQGKDTSARNGSKFTVLWSEDEDSLRIDLNNDRDFRDEVAVSPYAKSGAFGVIGTDDPRTSERETIAYAVQRSGDYISITFGLGEHASMVAGAAAAARGSRGRINGVAPGAQLLTVAYGGRPTSYARAAITAVSDPRSDIILMEGRTDVTGFYTLRDQRSLLATVLQRLVKRYRKPVFVTASNEIGMGTSSDEGFGDDVLSVGAYQSAESVFANKGLKTRHSDSLHWVGSEGPSGDGALKPDFLAPANPMTLSVGFLSSGLQRYDGIYKLPSGYQVGGGTSTATPVASGAAAILVSAAKQTGRTWDAYAINRALRSTARFLPNIPAYKQGRGIIQVEAAWRRMQAEAAEVASMNIRVEGPVRTRTSAKFVSPHRGRGLLETDGWRPGDDEERTILLTRLDGPPGPVFFDIEWLGNHLGTFSSERRVGLTLGQPVPFKLRIRPEAIGAHSAIARLRHPTLPGSAVQIPATVIAPYEFNAENGFTQDIDFQLDRPGRKDFFFYVPEGVDALDIRFRTAPRKRNLGFIAPPSGNHSIQLIRADANTGIGSTSIPAPEPGVWRLTFGDWADDAFSYDWSSQDKDYLPPTSLKLSVSLSAIEAQTPPALTEDGDLALSLHNRFAKVSGMAFVGVGAMRQTSGLLTSSEPQVFDLNVEDGASFLISEVVGASISDGDIDLYMFDCTAGSCAPAGSGISYGALERVIVREPKRGTWKAVLIAHDAGDEKAAFKYQDAYVHPRFGGVHFTHGPMARDAGEKWPAHGHLWLGAAVPIDRTRAGVLIFLDKDKRAIERPHRRSDASWWNAVPERYIVPVGVTYFPVE